MEAGIERAKQAAAESAAAEVLPGQRLGLGTGSTAAYAVRAIARRFPDGGGLRCVASSQATGALASSLGLAVAPLAAGDIFDLMLDGADEVSDAFDLTKGGGGALFREKLLARRARRLLIMVDPTKLVPKLGTRAPIPVEVVPFARPVVLEALEGKGLPARLRVAADGRTPFRSDNGLEIVDLHPPAPIEQPGPLDQEIHGIPGVLDTGIFVGLANRVYVGHPDGTVELRRAR
jgi:ribose 5-phosphate isomerase A